MTRRLLIRCVLLLILLTGGAIVNVAVAWAGAYVISRDYLRAHSGSFGIGDSVCLHIPWGLPANCVIWEQIMDGNGIASSKPLRVISHNLAINTIFYAAVLWVMFFAPFALRRRLRIRRGLCPACAYPIGSSPVCTECGTNLPLPLGEGRGEGA